MCFAGNPHTYRTLTAKIQSANIVNQYKNMGNTGEKKQLKEMRDFLSERKMISELAKRAGVGVRTVYDTFAQASAEELKFKQILVFKTAIEMIAEIKQLPELAKKTLE